MVYDKVDYTKYSLEDLYCAYESIDKEKYPERASEIESYILKLGGSIGSTEPETVHFKSCTARQVKKLFYSGLSKEEVYRKLSTENYNPVKVSRVLSQILEKDTLQMNKKVHIGFVISLCVFYLTHLAILIIGDGLTSSLSEVLFYSVLGLIIPSIVVFTIYKGHIGGFYLLCFFLFKGVLDDLAIFEQNPFVISVAVSFNVVLFCFAVYVKNRLYPYQSFFHNKKDIHGNYVFKSTK
ncbi:hypothetical protein [Pseudoalteromonas rubra]|uniref:hypothetical protein n=1 Tax=Pseudoalteromonas rubra TaxID=43658 RepID=UPI00026C9E07|nr:hypothetical protein [Pseudoalteromonas rubra]